MQTNHQRPRRTPEDLNRMRPESRADQILERLTREIEARRHILDAGVTFNSVHFLVTFNVHDDTIRKVIIRTEMGHE